MNIILLVIDTLRYDHIGFHGKTSVDTPNMNSIAARSMVYDRAFSASYPTIPHRTDVITGMYGAPFHVWMPLPFSWPTLPRILADHGYATQLIHDTPHLVNGGHNFDYPFHAWTMIRGAEVDRPWLDTKSSLPPNFRFDPMCDELGDLKPSYQSYFRANRKREAPDDWNCARLFDTVSEFIRDNAGRGDDYGNFFLWVDCFDPHDPLDSPPEFVRKYDDTPGSDGTIDPRLLSLRVVTGVSEKIVRRMKALYAAKVSWVDHNIGRMLTALEESGLAKNTAIVLTADHGTQLAERGRFGKKSPVKEQEGHVPLLVMVPGGGVGRSNSIVQPQDIFATILGIAGIPTPAGMDCRNLLASDKAVPEREIAISGYAAPMWEQLPYPITVFDGEYYLNASLDVDKSLLTPMGSTDNVAESEPSVVRRLHDAGLYEIERRGAVPELMSWLRSAGKEPFPWCSHLHDGFPIPAGYEQYWGRGYRER